jgi:hypothetical protein
MAARCSGDNGFRRVAPLPAAVDKAFGTRGVNGQALDSAVGIGAALVCSLVATPGGIRVRRRWL